MLEAVLAADIIIIFYLHYISTKADGRNRSVSLLQELKRMFDFDSPLSLIIRQSKFYSLSLSYSLTSLTIKF